MKTKQYSSNRRLAMWGSLIAAAIMLLGSYHKAHAQWTTNGNDVYKTNTAGNVGIGTTNPISKFQVNKTIRIDDDSGSATGSDTLGAAPALYLGTTGGGAMFQFNAGGGIDLWQYNAAWGRTFTYTKGGKVGIGTTSFPFTGATGAWGNLNVLNNISVMAPTTANEIGYDLILPSFRPYGQVNGWSMRFVAASAIGGCCGGSPVPIRSLMFFSDTSNGTASGNAGINIPLWLEESGNVIMGTNTGTGYYGGNVGIGTAAPASKLDVAGQIRSSTGGFMFPDGSVQTIAGTRSASDLSSGTLPDARFPAVLPSASGAYLTALNANSLASGTVATARLGSGTANATSFLRGDNTWAVPSGGSQWNNGGSNSISYSSGNVGIGTTVPDAKLTVAATSLPTTYNQGEVATFIGSSDNFTTVAIVRGNVTNPQGLHLGVNNSSHYSEIQASQDGVATNSLVLNRQGGNVGIGTPSPNSKLEVAGNISVTGTGNLTAAGTITGGNIVARYQDVAEWVPSSEQMPTGTVVVLDSTKSNQVISSNQAYDTRVAGVVSAQPGIALGESGTGKVLVATTGRVLVKVDATNGSIHIGDLLVTSDIPGRAMKSEPIKVGGRFMHMPGTLIGKALEPLEKGSGKILVLLSLQ